MEQGPAGPCLSLLCVVVDKQESSEGEGLGGDQQGEGVGAYIMQLKKKGWRKKFLTCKKMAIGHSLVNKSRRKGLS